VVSNGGAMSAPCCHPDPEPPSGQAPPPGYARVLWIALLVNLAMFALEIAAGLSSGSVSLLADAIDFFGDAANYGISLAVLSLGVAWRAGTALLKAASMAAFGIAVLGRGAWSAWQGIVPEPATMGVVGLLALAANLVVAALLYRYRDGDANMRSVWLCTRNDALGNLAVMGAALGVYGSGSALPDLLVAGVMAGLALTAAWSVSRQATGELRAAR
jgi:Co/Zn/Cd efflux system component